MTHYIFKRLTGTYIWLNSEYMRPAYCSSFLILLLMACSGEKEYTKPIISDITVSLYASANVKADNQHAILSSASGIIKQVNVEPGDLVEKGSALFVLEDTQARLDADNAREMMNYASQRSRRNSEELLEASFQVQATKDKYIVDSALFLRQKNLWEQNVGTRLEFDQRQLAFANSKISYEAAVNRSRQLNKQLLNDLKLSKINYQISRDRQSDYLIKSDIKGKVFDIMRRAGERVSQQTPLCIVGSADQFYLEMNVDENDIISVKKGQRTEISMDSYPGRTFEGRVSKIYPIMDERTRTFKIEAVFSNLPPKLYPNLTAEVNIVIDVRRKALLIPRRYLDEENQVWLKGNEKRSVTIGVQDERNVEILSGLDRGDIIFKPAK